MDNLITAIQSVWCVEERVEWTVERAGDLAEYLRIVEQVKQICGALCSGSVSLL
jgi:hypothetical protein